MKVTVLGASGVVGRALLPELSRDHDVVAVSRHPPDQTRDRIRWLTADATRPPELAEALRGTEVVYHLVHSLGARDFAERDRLAADGVAAAAERAGVRQIVFLGGLGDERRRPVGAPPQPSRDRPAPCSSVGPRDHHPLGNGRWEG